MGSELTKGQIVLMIAVPFVAALIFTGIFALMFPPFDVSDPPKDEAAESGP